MKGKNSLSHPTCISNGKLSIHVHQLLHLAANDFIDGGRGATRPSPPNPLSLGKGGTPLQPEEVALLS